MPSDKGHPEQPRDAKAASRPTGENEREILGTKRSARFDHQFEGDLAQAVRHVYEGHRRVQTQRAYVTKLRGRGANSVLAESLLVQFEDQLAMHRLHLARLFAIDEEDPGQRARRK